MSGRKWIMILIVFVTISQQIQASCVCNEKGTDGCTCGGNLSPKPNHVERPEFNLPPVGDNCWCTKTKVEPASLPKPCPKYDKRSILSVIWTKRLVIKLYYFSKLFHHNKPPTTCGCQPTYLPPTYPMPQVNYPYAYIKDNNLPADPISISLAIQADKAIQVPEAKLAYGFVRKPINGLPKLYISSIKEENLYALAKDVITLQKPTSPKTKKMEEDYPEPEEEDEIQPEEYAKFSLSYKQLGYGPDNYQNPTFIRMPLPAEATDSLFHGIGGSDSDCGYKPDSITEIKHQRKYGPTNCLMKHY